MTFLDWLNVGQGITGLVGGLIRQHERPGNGEAKKVAVVEQALAIVCAGLEGVGAKDTMNKETHPTDMNLILKLAGRIVDEQVGLANATGEFKRTPDTPINLTREVKVHRAEFMKP